MSDCSATQACTPPLPRDHPPAQPLPNTITHRASPCCEGFTAHTTQDTYSPGHTPKATEHPFRFQKLPRGGEGGGSLQGSRSITQSVCLSAQSPCSETLRLCILHQCQLTALPGAGSRPGPCNEVV